MAEPTASIPDVSQEELEKRIEEVEYTGRHQGPRMAVTIGVIAAVWSLFQLWIASPLPFMFGIGIIVDVPARGIHLAFGLLLCFLIFPASRKQAARPIGVVDMALALLGCGAALYLFLGYEGLVKRDGIPLDIDVFGFRFPFETVLGGIGIVLLLEATRRSIGLPLVVVAGIFLIYSIFGQSMPDLISHRGMSLSRLIGYQWLGGEAIFGIPIDVSVSFVFLFVLFGALLEKAGAGRYFLNLSFSMVGRFSGGPAKAAILASGMTGVVSGSSIANVVTTGTFTIPVMKQLGMPATKAGAIEVAASTNGQLMPPVMGAAAFIIAELIGISYFEVVKAAFIPAFVSYIALLYISHLESQKLGLRGMPANQIPPLGKTFIAGIHFLIPIVALVYLLMVERWTAGTAVFYSIILTMIIIVVERVYHEVKSGEADAVQALKDGVWLVYGGLVSGARNMINIAIAVAAAGIIVGAVSSTGLNNALVGVVETISGGNVYVLLLLTAVLCLILGMGLPTTANYLVVASLLVGVLVELGGAAGLVLPLIAVHLFIFYFGILADSTPPVCLAAFAAAAISRADPIKTGIQGFMYDIRTAILPFVFIFNPELLLVGVESFWHGLMIFCVSLIAILAFGAATQGWMLVKTRWYETIMLLIVMGMLFRPGFFMDFLHPEFATIELAKFVSGETVAPPDAAIRFHVVRSTDYGDRYKLFRVTAPDDAKANTLEERYGLTVQRNDKGRYKVTNLVPNAAAERGGMKIGDAVTEIDVQQVDQPPKYLVYPFGLALLGVVIGLQMLRQRKRQPVAAA
ncbi:MAG: TRAP transporter permease [Rhodospirillales bacterium]